MKDTDTEELFSLINWIYWVEKQTFDPPYNISQLQQLFSHSSMYIYFLTADRDIRERREFLNKQKSPDGRLFTGYAILFKTRDDFHRNIFELYRFAIHPDFRRQGYGTYFLSSLIHISRTGEKISKIFLEVSEKNSAAISLYRKAGFHILTRRKNYYKDSDGLVMELSLEENGS